MAKMRNGILDGLSGKIGPVVAYQWKGRYCLRGREVNYKDPRSPKQQVRRQLFGVASKLASAMLPAVSIGFRGPAVAGQTTERGCFMRSNKQCFSMVDYAVHVDYTAIQVAQGELAGVVFGEPRQTSGNRVEVVFSPDMGNLGNGNDYVYFFAYVPSLQQGLLSQPVKRYSRCVCDTLPRWWTGRETHLYGFTWDTELSASNSTYIGTLLLDH